MVGLWKVVVVELEEAQEVIVVPESLTGEILLQVAMAVSLYIQEKTAPLGTTGLGFQIPIQLWVVVRDNQNLVTETVVIMMVPAAAAVMVVVVVVKKCGKAQAVAVAVDILTQTAVMVEH